MKDQREVSFAETPFLDGTVGAHLDRLNRRATKLLVQQRDLIQGKRILDIACHDGRFSHACLLLGAQHVHGVEGRQHHVDDANRFFLDLGHEPSRFRFEQGDIFDFLPKCEPGQFDTILCFGFLYHTVRQIEMLQEFQRLNPQAVIIDTYVHPQRQWIKWLRVLWRMRPRHLSPQKFAELVRTTEADEIFQLAMEDATKDGSSITGGGTPVRENEKRYGAVAVNFHPTSAALERLFDYHGFDFEKIDWHAAGISDWSNLGDYKTKRRVSYVVHAR